MDITKSSYCELLISQHNYIMTLTTSLVYLLWLVVWVVIITVLCRSRDVRDTERSPSPRRHTRSDKPEKKSKSKTVKVSEEDEEIKQANALRKSLGIKPLRTD